MSELENEIVTALSERLRDTHGCVLTSHAEPDLDRGVHTYRLHPHGGIVVTAEHQVVTVDLNGLPDVDTRDLFTAVISTVEQRHTGLRAEID